MIPEAIAVIDFKRFWSLKGEPLIGISPNARAITRVIAAMVSAVCMNRFECY